MISCFPRAILGGGFGPRPSLTSMIQNMPANPSISATFSAPSWNSPTPISYNGSTLIDSVFCIAIRRFGAFLFILAQPMQRPDSLF